MRILYVEDRDIFVQIARSALLDFDVVAAASFDEAMRLLHSDEIFDVALVDINLTDEKNHEGYDVLEYIKEHRPNLRRIVVTGAENIPGPIYRNIIKKYEVDEVLIKGPNHIPDLRAAVGALIDSMKSEQLTSPRTSLSERELEVLKLVVDGKTASEIGVELVLSPRTVERHIHNICIKLQVKGKAALIKYALQHRLFDA